MRAKERTAQAKGYREPYNGKCRISVLLSEDLFNDIKAQALLYNMSLSRYIAYSLRQSNNGRKPKETKDAKDRRSSDSNEHTN